MQLPGSIFSKTKLDFLKELTLDINELEKGFDVDFYLGLGLSRGLYFDKKTWGFDKVVAGDPGGAVADLYQYLMQEIPAKAD